MIHKLLKWVEILMDRIRVFFVLDPLPQIKHLVFPVLLLLSLGLVFLSEYVLLAAGALLPWLLCLVILH